MTFTSKTSYFSTEKENGSIKISFKFFPNIKIIIIKRIYYTVCSAKSSLGPLILTVSHKLFSSDHCEAFTDAFTIRHTSDVTATSFTELIQIILNRISHMCLNRKSLEFDRIRL